VGGAWCLVPLASCARPDELTYDAEVVVDYEVEAEPLQCLLDTLVVDCV
jgi:hypothetical protein